MSLMPLMLHNRCMYVDRETIPFSYDSDVNVVKDCTCSN